MRLRRRPRRSGPRGTIPSTVFSSARGGGGTFADVSAFLDGTVDATDREALAQAVQELRKRLDAPQPPNAWAAGHYGFPKP
ncbi:hypothetical protein [Kitasatospora sp. MAP5-34]|uniref:hypothetical protein n=1 Tax=Kitasatospora sp. MAP5-34 TaxID=3035102 RepID=UPI0024740C70|nr:hypothetical protein [Kitasatospora sp. MAP5-34]